MNQFKKAAPREALFRNVTISRVRATAAAVERQYVLYIPVAYPGILLRGVNKFR
jgi:hypothetical protein